MAKSYDIQIENLTAMIHMVVNGTSQSIMNESIGYADRLQRVVDDGGYASEGTMEIMSLSKDLQYLREMEQTIERLREGLINNAKALA